MDAPAGLAAEDIAERRALTPNSRGDLDKMDPSAQPPAEVEPNPAPPRGPAPAAPTTPSALAPPRRDVPRWLWIGLPVGVVAFLLLAPLLIEPMGYDRWDRFLQSERGVLELATLALLAPSVVASAWLLIRRRKFLPRPMGVFVALGGLAALFFLGEEASWGQHLFGFEPPASIAENNLQREFNIHNVEAEWRDLFNNVPRQLMFVASLVGGIILPLVLRPGLDRPGRAGSFWSWLIPTRVIVPAGVFAVLSTVPEKIYKGFDLQRVFPEGGYVESALVVHGGESKELAYAMVIFIYFASLAVRAPRSREEAARLGVIAPAPAGGSGGRPGDVGA